jgi:hypothetical protein
MKSKYEAEKEAKKKTTRQVMWLLLALLVLFSIVIIRVAARTGANEGFFNSEPSGDDAYEIAKDYVRPTLKSPAEFATEGYQYTKAPDSVFIIKSYFVTEMDNHTKTKTGFTVKIKYNGGMVSNDRNWSLLTMLQL